MFPLRDTTRRQIGFAAFLALCVVPTVLVLAWGVERHLPWHARGEAERLSRHLGQKVALARVRHLRPGVLVYEGFELCDPETRKRLVRIARLEVRWETTPAAPRASRPRLALAASQMEIETADLAPLWQLAHGALTGRLACFDGPVRLTAREVTMPQGPIPLTLTGLEGRIQRLSGGSQADVAFRVVGFETPKPVQIRVVRSHETEPPATGGGLYTGEGALPCSLLQLAFPQLAAWNPESRFRGYLWTSPSPEGWSGELAGQLTGVDLDRLLSAHFPHTLRGAATVTIQQAIFQRGRLQEATGSLAAGPGVISRSLVDAAADRLGMDRAPAPEGPDPLLAYDRLALSFRADSGGLQLRGECPPAGSGAILIDRHRLLLREPMVQPLPVTALLQALAPATESQVPATCQTDWLMRRLPVAQVPVPQMAEAPGQSTR